jgi:predicted transcriptional regulator
MFRNMSSEETGRPGGPPGDPEQDTLNLADPRAMRAMAHPVRMALMELLAASRTLTATQASEVLGESPANCAFHLRTLAKYGFVREAGGGKGRERPWTRAHRSISIDTAGQADARAELAARTLSEAYGERMLQRVRYAYTNAVWPKGWEQAVISGATVRFLTAEEAVGISLEIRAIIDRYQSRIDDPGGRPAGALPVQVAHYIFPMAELAGLDEPPGRPGDPDGDSQPGS